MSHNISNHPYIISLPDLLCSTPNSKGVGYVYYESMLKHSNKIAQIDGYSGKQESFNSLLKRCVQAAVGMQIRGIKPGDVISLCTLPDIDTCVPYIASLFVGAITASVDPFLSVPEIVYLLKQALPKIIFVSQEAVSVIEKVTQELQVDIIIVVFGKSAAHITFSEFLDVVQDEDMFKPREVDNLNETALLIFSSGTTGRPKGICHSHFSILSNNTVGENEPKTIITFCTPYWCIYHLFIHLSILNGYKRLIFSKFDMNNPWEIFNFKIDLTILTPLQSMAFTKHKKPHNANLSNLAYLHIGSFYMSKEDILTLKSCLPKTTIHFTYGQTEIFRGVFNFLQNEEGQHLIQKYPNSVGCPLPGIEYKIINIEDEKILGPNKQGELRLKSNCQTTGYWNLDSVELFDEDGWLKTGDLAYYNEEHCFFITDRIKESFKYLGYHISPIEIENVLSTHPAIKHSVVLGVPHETEANHPMAVVVLNEHCSKITPEDIVKYVEERVENIKRLRGGVQIVDSIPMTVSNKFCRFKLREMLKINKI